MEDRIKERYFTLAINGYRQSDEKKWVSALACAGVVGGYERGATLGLASDMGVSSDTVEDLAHGYEIYRDLCALDDGKYRKFVRDCRKSPYIYHSHFQNLWHARRDYKLTDTQILNFLMDVYQAEGGIPARQLDGHIRGKHGDTRGWEFYGQKAAKELSQTLQQPDLPNVPEEVGNAYQVSWKVGPRKHKVVVIALNPQRAVNIAKKELSKTVDEKLLPIRDAEITPIGPVITDSKHILTTAHGWLGEKS